MVSFLYSLDKFLLKNLTVFSVESQISKWRSFEKMTIFDLLFTFFSHLGEDKKIPSAHIPLIHTRILLTILNFLPSEFFKNWEFIMYGFPLV